MLFLLSLLLGLFFWPLLAIAPIFFLVALAQAITHAVGGKVNLSCPACRCAEVIPLGSPGGALLVERVQARR